MCVCVCACMWVWVCCVGVWICVWWDLPPYSVVVQDALLLVDVEPSRLPPLQRIGPLVQLPLQWPEERKKHMLRRSLCSLISPSQLCRKMIAPTIRLANSLSTTEASSKCRQKNFWLQDGKKEHSLQEPTNQPSQFLICLSPGTEQNPYPRFCHLQKLV